MNKANYLWRASKFFLRNYKRMVNPKGTVQTISYYIKFPSKYYNFMSVTYKDWHNFKRINSTKTWREHI